ncbi:unnamed protein product [Arctogadus glacialis]
MIANDERSQLLCMCSYEIHNRLLHAFILFGIGIVFCMVNKGYDRQKVEDLIFVGVCLLFMCFKAFNGLCNWAGERLCPDTGLFGIKRLD